MNKDRILRSLDASLIILHVTTAPKVSNEVQLEESIDQVISHTKYHLENNIYPEFDPVYRSDGKGKGEREGGKICTYTCTVSIRLIILFIFLFPFSIFTSSVPLFLYPSPPSPPPPPPPPLTQIQVLFPDKRDVTPVLLPSPLIRP